MPIESIEFRRLNRTWVMGIDDHERDELLTKMELKGAVLVSTSTFQDGNDWYLLDTFRWAGE